MTATSTDLFDQALSLHKQGRLGDALPLYRRAIEIGPEFPDLLIAAGIAFSMDGRLDEAIQALRRATEIAPANPLAHTHLGTLLNDAGRFREAAEILTRAADLSPKDATILTNLGCSYRALGRLEEALDAFQRAVRLDPTMAEIQSNLATALVMDNRPAEAGLRLYVAIALDPAYADAYSNLGAVMLRGALPDSRPAMYVLQRAVQINPDLPTAHSNLSVILAGRGEPDIAVPHNMRAAELAPNPENWSRVLFNLNYCDSWSAEDCAQEHKRIGALFDAAGAALRLPPVSAGSGGRHRVGFVSPDFRNHSVSYFLRPLLAAIDRGKFEIFCYSDVLKGDDVTAEIRSRADHWIEAVGLTDVELAHKVRADRIDTLIDLAGHTPANRMGTFALRPAPVQMTWLGYANTSGLKTIDYRIVDDITDPPGQSDALASETLLRLPGGFLCYGPPPYAPPPAVRPPAADGAVVFGTFNNPTKITDATFALWSRLLIRLPKAKLLIKSFRLRDEVLRRHIVEKFVRNGVAEDRLILLDANADAVEHLAAYGQIDIGLDPVLYNGTTTTFEALWMGVPVIAERGDRHAGRVGASLLTHAGLGELVAENGDAYIQIACRLAENPSELARLRDGLRERLAASPLCDAQGFARKFEAALLRAAPARPLDALRLKLAEPTLDLSAVAAARDALAVAVRADLAAIPTLEELAPICRTLTLLGLRTGPAMVADGDPTALGAILAHCLTAPAYTLPALPALDALPPQPLATLASLLLEEPPFWSRRGEPELYAAHIETVLTLASRGLAAQPSAPGAADAALRVAAACHFSAAMVSDRPLNEAIRQRAMLIELWLAGQSPTLDHDFAPVAGRRPRFGVFRSGWEPGAETALALNHIEELKPDGDIIVYTLRPLGESDSEKKASALADRVAALPDSLADIVTAIRADDLDLLVIGHDLTTHLTLPAALGAYRLARLQAAIAAGPAAPAFSRLDLWLGEEPTLPREWIPEGPLPVRLTRAEIGVPDGRVLLISAVPLQRLTAELLGCWGRILADSPNTHLLLYPFDQSWKSHPAVPLAELRLRALLGLSGADQQRVTILPPGVTKAGARAVLALADLYLDGFPLSEVAELLDPLSVGLPMLLCRQFDEMARRYGLPALVAGNLEEYEKTALSLVAAPDQRIALRDEAPACRKRLQDRGALISWRSFQSRVAPSDRQSDRNLDG